MKRIMPALLLVSASMFVKAHDYPTLERVDHVMTCMRTNGGQNVDNLYACSCEIDIIAQQLSFDDYSEARTFEIYKRMPGEKGSLFRDSARAKDIVGKLEQVRVDANKRCFIGKKMPHVQSPNTAPAGATSSGAPVDVTPPPGGS
jgi:hypothetical protein